MARYGLDITLNMTHNRNKHVFTHLDVDSDTLRLIKDVYGRDQETFGTVLTRGCASCDAVDEVIPRLY